MLRRRARELGWKSLDCSDAITASWSRLRKQARSHALSGLAALAILTTASRPIAAQDAPAPAPVPSDPAPASPRIELRHNLALDAAVTGALGVGLITWAAFIKPKLSTPTCTICDEANGKVNAIDDFFRSNLKAPNSPAGTISDFLAYGIAPATGLAFALVVPAYDHRTDEAPLDMLLVAQASLAFAALQQTVTALVPRERPSAHAVVGDGRKSAIASRASLESFPAGHSGEAFAIAASGGTIATMRGYRLAPLVWITGGAIALVTSYLRIAADHHYFTDVVTGATLGIGTGIAVPLLFHRPVSERPSTAERLLQGAMVSTTEVPGGRIVAATWAF